MILYHQWIVVTSMPLVIDLIGGDYRLVGLSHACLRFFLTTFLEIAVDILSSGQLKLNLVTR